MIAMAVGLIVLGAMYSVFTLQNKQFVQQDMVTEMQQNARAGIEMMVREIRMAGYNPAKKTTGWSASPTTSPGQSPGIITADASSITFVADLDGDSDTRYNDGTTNGNPNENITYDLCLAAICTTCSWQCLARTSNGTKTPAAENIEALTFKYYNSSGTELTAPVTAAADLASIRKIEVTIKARSAREEPTYTSGSGDHYYHYEVKSQVTLRNMGL